MSRRGFRVPGFVWPTLIAAAVFAAGGCTKQYVPTAQELASTTTAPPDRVGVIGERFEFGGIDVVVSDITAFERSPDGLPRIRAVIRSKNVTDTERNNPVAGLRCDESDALGEWLRGSTWETGAVLPAGVVTQGELLVGFPMKPENELYAVASCTNARLRLSLGGPSTGVQVVEYSIPPEIVSESIDRPRGRPLPLPLESR